jgi:hypothetical protein
MGVERGLIGAETCGPSAWKGRASLGVGIGGQIAFADVQAVHALGLVMESRSAGAASNFEVFLWRTVTCSSRSWEPNYYD